VTKEAERRPSALSHTLPWRTSTSTCSSPVSPSQRPSCRPSGAHKTKEIGEASSSKRHPSFTSGTGTYRLNKPRAAVLLYGCTAPFPQHCPLMPIALIPSLAVRSAPAARSTNTTAVEHKPNSAAIWRAALPACKGARKGTRHGQCGEHETRAPQHRRARPGVTSVGSGRGTHQQGLCY